MRVRLHHISLVAPLLAGCGDVGSLPTAPTQPTTVPASPDPSTAGLARLTHLQWENTVVDLLGLPEPTGYSEGFVADPHLSVFDNDASGLSVNPTLWQQYQSAAEAMALRVVTDPELMDSIAPEGDPAEWIAAFGRRAYRRDLVTSEREHYTALFEEGPTLFGDADPWTDGVHACIAAFLQSPHFLYRSQGGAGDELTADRLAEKLAYSLWNHPPDELLADAAADGLTDAEIALQVERMLTHPWARDMVIDLHRQLYYVDNYPTIYREGDMVFDDYAYSVNASMERELEQFASDAVFGGGTVRTLFTSRDTWVDRHLAPIYGIEGVAFDEVKEGDEIPDLVPAVLDPDTRSGLLTLSGFLAYHADKTTPNLIRRGGFVADRILCRPVPAPPADATALPKADDDDMTLRERVAAHTTECGGACHTDLMNPIGFALGEFWQDGRHVTTDHDKPIDATGEIALENGTHGFDGAVALSAILAEAEETHRCYAGHLVTYLDQRALTQDDTARLDALTAGSLSGWTIRDMIVDIVTDEAFRTRDVGTPSD